MTSLDAGSFIHGRRLAGSGPRLANLDPATGAELGQVETASAADVDVAIASARDGLQHWSAVPGATRGRVLAQAAALLRERTESLARLEVLDTGKPIHEAREFDLPAAAECLEYYAGLCSTLSGTHHDLPPQAFAYTRREPLGVCVGLGAWNYPLQLCCWKLGPALCCGNAMVYKPSPLAPLSILQLAELLCEAGLPPGVFNVVQGDAEVGRALVRHPHVAKVSLTGSLATGRAVMADAATGPKPVTLELGGISPLLVFADADLERAVSTAIDANFSNQGEVCSNGTRVFVHTSVVDRFLAALVPRVEALRVGHPMDPRTRVGALISAEHRDRVLDALRLGEHEGARVLTGGEPGPDPILAEGFFVRPAVLSGCADHMRVVQTEIFGPVMRVLTFEHEDEVVARANATPDGLAAGICTTDLARAHRVAARVRAGVCWINGYNVSPTQLPFGGTGTSGFGRENGLAALEAYSQLKTVYVDLGVDPGV